MTAVPRNSGNHRKALNLRMEQSNITSFEHTSRSVKYSSNENTVDLYSSHEYFEDSRAGTPAELADREQKNLSISL